MGGLVVQCMERGLRHGISFYVWENKTSFKFKSSESSDLNYRWFVYTCNSLITIINELQIRKRKNISSWVIACKFSDGGMLQCLCQSLWSATILWRQKLVPRSDPRLHWWTNHQHNSVNICTTRIVSFNIESSDQLSENRRKWETFILVDQMSAWSYQVMSVSNFSHFIDEFLDYQKQTYSTVQKF